MNDGLDHDPQPDSGPLPGLAPEASPGPALDEQLRQAQERFALAFEEAPVGMAIVGPGGRILEVNRALGEILGRTEDELLRTDAQTLSQPEDRAVDEALVARLMQGHAVHERLDKRYLRPDGTVVPVSLHISLLRSSDGSPASFIVQVVDISHRRRVEQALSDERDFLTALLQSVDAGVVACDADGRLTIVNAFAARVHDAPSPPLPGELWPGSRVLRAIDGRLLPADELPLLRALGGEHVRDADVVVQPAAGPSVHLSVNAQTIRAADGRPLGAVAVQHDVTARRQLEDALRAAELLWRDAFDHGPVGMAIVALDAGTRAVRSANQALGALVGDDPVTLEGRPLDALAWAPDDATHLASLLQDVAAHPGSRQGDELRLRHRDGSPVWVQVAVTSRPDPAGGMLAVVHLHDISERRSVQDRLEHLADHDPLTGYFNRRRFDEELERFVAFARRHERPGALLLFDLDQFKYVNDTYGHPAGDEVLRHIGGVLRRRLRATDVLARIGGDEFAVLLAETGPQDAVLVAEQILDALRGAPTTMSTGQTLVLTASIGVAPINGQWQLTPGELLMEADIAMYDAKDAGRNQLVVASAERRTHAKMKSRLSWAARVRDALDGDRFVLHAQPIASVTTGAIVRHELLIRMRDEADGGALVAPGRFLGIAERFGQILDIDRWVMRQAAGTLAQDPGRHLAINLSGSSIGDARTVALLAELLGEANVDPGRLTVEITETAAIRSIDTARGFAQRLADLGCRLALDDFGAGFGSFFYLKHLPFHSLKIDGEFIRGMATSRSDRLTVQAIVQIAKGLGKETTAEYVADEQTLAAVRELGVDFAQGYLVGEPGPLIA